MLFNTRLSYHLMRKLLKNSQMVFTSNKYLLLCTYLCSEVIKVLGYLTYYVSQLLTLTELRSEDFCEIHIFFILLSIRIVQQLFYPSIIWRKKCALHSSCMYALHKILQNILRLCKCCLMSFFLTNHVF